MDVINKVSKEYHMKTNTQKTKRSCVFHVKGTTKLDQYWWSTSGAGWPFQILRKCYFHRWVLWDWDSSWDCIYEYKETVHGHLSMELKKRIVKSTILTGSWYHCLPVGILSLIRRGRFYGSCVQSTMLHGSDTWPVRKENEVALQRTETRMVRWMCNYITLH